jgi:hypothetical protein
MLIHIYSIWFLSEIWQATNLVDQSPLDFSKEFKMAPWIYGQFFDCLFWFKKLCNNNYG